MTAGYYRIPHTSRPPVKEGRRRKSGRRPSLVSPFSALPELGVADLDGDSPEMSLESTELTLSTIADAARQRKTVVLRYRDQQGHVTEREVEPYEIKVRAGRLGLYAYCLLRKETRFFEVNGRHAGIMSARLSESLFEPRWEIKVGVETEEGAVESERSPGGAGSPELVPPGALRARQNEK